MAFVDTTKLVDRTMLSILEVSPTEMIAERLERAYRLRRPNRRIPPASVRVWEAVAATLVELHQGDPSLPLDPEFYVAMQVSGRRLARPWALTRAEAVRRYRRGIRRLVRSLRRELRTEVRRAEVELEAGRSVASVVLGQDRRFSSLGRYIVARRAGRIDLAERFRAAAQDQHRAAPLYRAACRGLIPASAYPAQDVPPFLRPRPRPDPLAAYQLN